MQIVWFLLSLSLLILIHELGHFIAARVFNMEVEEFGIGFPPRLKKLFTWKGTLFSLNWLPIGGFVKIKGESYDPAEKPTPGVGLNLFWDKPIWQRAVVLLAGVFGNFVLGVVLFGVVYSVMGVPTQMEKVRVVGVADGSPAAEAGMREGELITGLQVLPAVDISNGREPSASFRVTNTEDLVKLINENKGKEIALTLEGEEGEREVKVIPRENPPKGEGSLGVLLSDVELRRLPWWQMPIKGAVVGTREAYAWGREIAGGLWNMLSGLVSGKGVPKDMAGPVGIYKISSQVNELGWLASLQFMGILSMNLAVLNILPFPALDGGRLVFLGLEMIIGKRLKNKIEGWVHGAGMILLLGLMVLVTIRDVMKIL